MGSPQGEQDADDNERPQHEVHIGRLATRRFGPLPPWAGARIAAAPIEQLDGWLDDIFDAGTLTDLLGPESEPPTH